MNTRVVVDASVWISQFMQTDTNHGVSEQWITDFVAIGGSFIEPLFLRIEVAAAISRLTKDTVTAREIVGRLTHTTLVNFLPMDDILIHTAIDMAIELQLRAGDTIYVAAAYQLGIPLISWDKEQLDRASRIITTYSPTTYIF